VLYDGHCKFCTAQSRNLVALAKRGAVEAVNFQAPGALEHFPGLTHDACMTAMHLIAPDGRVYRGFEAAVQAVATRPIFGRLAYLYYLPGLRQLLDRLYAYIAANRYRFWGKPPSADDCPDGTCSLHARPR
jgi:predicted DCC family thiol-disulfide oxidoreductase YuxK